VPAKDRLGRAASAADAPGPMKLASTTKAAMEANHRARGLRYFGIWLVPTFVRVGCLKSSTNFGKWAPESVNIKCEARA
jgi:hypothetical protein